MRSVRYSLRVVRTCCSAIGRRPDRAPLLQACCLPAQSPVGVTSSPNRRPSGMAALTGFGHGATAAFVGQALKFSVQARRPTGGPACAAAGASPRARHDTNRSNVAASAAASATLSAAASRPCRRRARRPRPRVGAGCGTGIGPRAGVRGSGPRAGITALGRAPQLRPCHRSRGETAGRSQCLRARRPAAPGAAPLRARPADDRGSTRAGPALAGAAASARPAAELARPMPAG